MNKELKVNPCTKCGHDEYNLNTTWEENRGFDTVRIIFVSMTATCKMCGWRWYIAPLDEQ